MTFSDVRVGERFFDPFSGEFWEKTSPATALCDSGGDGLEGRADEFNPHDVVEPE